MRDIMRAKPTKNAGSKSIKELTEGFAKRSQELAGEGQPYVATGLHQTVAPTAAEIADMDNFERMVALHPIQYAGNVSDYDVLPSQGTKEFFTSKRQPSTVLINPNADEIYLAHELGHTASTNTKVGDMVRRIRDYTSANPKAARALGLAAGLTPIAAGAMTPGDDDLDEAIVGSLALASPALIDEALASKNALAIMKAAGRKPTMGQYGRLAGGYLSYLAAPIMTATVGNLVGNQLD